MSHSSSNALKFFYRKFFYKFCKCSERVLRSLVFYCAEKTWPLVGKQFNSFYLFGIPRKVVDESPALPFTHLIDASLEMRQKPISIEEKIPAAFSKLEAFSYRGTITCIKNGIATYDAAHLTSKGELIGSLTERFADINPHTHPLFKIRKARFSPSVVKTPLTVLSLAIDGYWNYYHWLLDALPKIHLATISGYSFDCIYAHYTSAFQKQTLELLGYGDQQVINAAQVPYLSSPSLIVPSFPGLSAIPKWAVDFLRARFMTTQNPSAYPKRIFISRKAASYRHILNEEALLPLLHKHGFTLLQLEKLTFQEQVAHFQHAEMVLAPHGAGLANLVFCSPGTKVIEVLAPRFHCICYWGLAHLVDVKYAFILGEKLSMTYSSESEGYDHIWLCEKKLEKMLQAFT